MWVTSSTPTDAFALSRAKGTEGFLSVHVWVNLDTGARLALLAATRPGGIATATDKGVSVSRFVVYSFAPGAPIEDAQDVTHPLLNSAGDWVNIALGKTESDYIAYIDSRDQCSMAVERFLYGGTITRTVELDGLTPGRAYTVTGALSSDGSRGSNNPTATKKFYAHSDTETVTMEYTLPPGYRGTMRPSSFHSAAPSADTIKATP